MRTKGAVAGIQRKLLLGRGSGRESSSGERSKARRTIDEAKQSKRRGFQRAPEKEGEGCPKGQRVKLLSKKRTSLSLARKRGGFKGGRGGPAYRRSEGLSYNRGELFRKAEDGMTEGGR